MAKQLFANNVSTQIMEFLSASDTTIAVSSTSRFPPVSGGDWIMATIVPQGGQGTPEIVKITAFSGQNVTVVRGQEGTTAQDFQFGSLMELRVTKGTLEEIRDITQAGAGATTRTKADKLNEVISVKDFGAVGDGITDDTVAVQAAMTYAINNDLALYFPPGNFRVTAGTTVVKAVSQLTLFGAARRGTSKITLDSSSAARFFFDNTAGGTQILNVFHLEFVCTQFVQDSDFFRFTSVGTLNIRFEDVCFTNVDRPLVFKSNAYVQSAHLIGVQFNDSGTIHSDSNVGSRGNLITMINVSHDGNVPTNTNKIVMDLQGWRGIQATNLLLEGSLPSTGWTVLRLDNEHDADWTQMNILQANGFWSEWAVNAPTYVVDQKGGRVTFSNAVFNLDTAIKYRLTQGAQVTVRDSSFIGPTSTDNIESMFSFEDYQCHAVLDRCTVRIITNKANDRFTYKDCSFSASGVVPFVTAAQFGTGQASLAAKWDGGYFDGDNIALTLSGGTTGTPSTDTVYGRKYILTPSGNSLNADFYLKLRNIISLGVRFNIVALVKLPTFTGGSITIAPLEQVSTVSGGDGYDTNYSGQVVKINIAVVGQGVATTVVGLRITSVATGVSGTCELYSLSFYIGNEMPRIEYPNYLRNILTYNSAQPAAGGWLQGDIVKNSSPAVGSPKGWVCTVTGTPGTWVSEGNL